MSGSSPVRRQKASVVKQPTLDELAEVIRKEHENCMRAMKVTVEYAVRAGEALLQARDKTMPEGKWTQWLEDNFPKDRSAAYTYMRLATHQSVLPSGIGVTAAEELVRGLPTITGGRPRTRVKDARRQDARRMRQEGKGYKEIAKVLEVSVSSVYAWLNSGTKKTRARRAEKALKEAETKKAIKSAVRKKGGAIAEAYSMAERLDDILGQAHREATDPEVRRELDRAHGFQHAMRDQIVRALGVEP